MSLRDLEASRRVSRLVLKVLGDWSMTGPLPMHPASVYGTICELVARGLVWVVSRREMVVAWQH
jgi:hypothetical protein